VNADELITADIAFPISDTAPAGNIIADNQISDIFGIEMDSEISANQEADMQVSAKKTKKSTKYKYPRKKVARVRVIKSRKPQKKTKKTVKKAALDSKVRKKSNRTIETSRKASKPSMLSRLRPTGNSVKKLRKKLGFSVPQLAEQLGVSSAIIYRWEKTRGRLNLQNRSLAAITQLHQQAMSKST